ncbi:transcriptional protein SWT1 isoform X1 [Strongylocentrotus purpuratus]|uniref:WW domain-containing protein n=1 Tax=Strongylocentrotus purpuratus TaxID=7668 RepID=A0A7M7PRI0_STRPU|nr:transcriptional protein SWT1 isoform X1 [Strongylocentrotus purpuratus]
MMGDEWVQRISRKRKTPYYFNTRTGVAQWDEPTINTEKTCKDQKKADTGEEENKGSPAKKVKNMSEPHTKSKSSPVKDCSPASKPMPSRCDQDPLAMPVEQQFVPRIIHPKKRKKRKRKKSSASSETPNLDDTPQKKYQDTEQPEPPDKSNSLKGPPAKLTLTVAAPESVMKETVLPERTNVNMSSPKGNCNQNKIIDGAPQPQRRTSLESVSLMEVDLPLRTEGKVLVVVDTNVLINSVKYVREIKGEPIKDLGDIMLTIPWMVMQELDLLKGPNCMAMTPLSSAARKALDFLHKNRTDPNIKGQSYNHFLKTKREKDVKETSDDKILRYCLQCKKKYPENLVVLLSNDKNLCVKASFSGVPSSGDRLFMDEIIKQVKSHSQLCLSSSDDNDIFSPSEECPSSASGRSSPEGAITCISPMEFTSPGTFQNNNTSTVKDLKTHSEDNERRKQPCISQQNDRKRTTPSPLMNQSDVNRPKPSSPASQSDLRTKSNITMGEKETKTQGRPSTSSTAPCGTVKAKSDLIEENIDHPHASDSATERKKKERDYTIQLTGFLRLALVVILRQEMVESYTDHWLEIVHKKPPWSLLDALQCIKKHYVAVFGLLLGRRNSEEVDQLISIVERIREEDSFTSKQLNSFHSAAKEILNPLHKKTKYKDVTTKCEGDIERVYRQWKKMIQEASKPTTSTVITQAAETPPRIIGLEPLEEKESVQESEDMCISPPATSSSNTPERGTETRLLIKNQGARQEMGERRGGDGMDHVTFCVLSCFEAVYTVLKYHRDVIVWSFKHLASGCPIEGLPTIGASLNYLSVALPLVEIIVQSLLRLIGSCIPVPLSRCAEVVQSLHAYVQALKLDLDISGFHPEILHQFLLTEDNRERIVVGSQQFSEVLQQLHECRVTLCQF